MRALLPHAGRALVLLACCPPRAAWAHAGDHGHSGAFWAMWSTDPLVWSCLVLSAALYLRGVARLRSRSRVGGGLSLPQMAAFAAGWLTLALALVSPLDPLGGDLFSAHMVQHEVMMLVAAPLLVLGRPLPVFLWGLPSAWRRAVVDAAKRGWWRATWRMLTRQLVAWTIHALVLWMWHAPALFQAAVEGWGAHTLQHLSFLGSALLFWWALLHGAQGAAGSGAAILYVFTTALHSSILGALLTFAPRVWYPVHVGRTEAWGLTPLEDQQLGGLIMWVPGGVVFLLAGLLLLGRWLHESEARTRTRETARLPARR